MSNAERYDAVVIGSGEGGKYLAWHLAQAGEKTAVVERRWIGGSCPNINCLPSKNEIWSAGVARIAARAGEFGVTTGPVSVEMRQVLQRKRDMVDGLVAFHLDRYKATGAELIMGTARLVEPQTVEVSLNGGGTRRLVADKLFLNLGTQASVPPVPGLAEAKPLTHIEALELDRLPDHLVVLGGGYVGLEFAQAYRRFGSRITIIERGPRLAKREDEDVSREIQRILEAEGIELLLSTEVERVEGQSVDDVRVLIDTPDGRKTIEGTDILVAAGRTPNTRGIGLEEAGIELTGRGYIRVNDRLETTAPNTWAIGECAGSPQFTHMSLDDFRVIRDNLSGGNRSTKDRMTPYCMFIDPPLARIGMSEEQARAKGVTARVAKLPTKAVLRTRTTSESAGFMKALVDADDRILGFTMIGSEAGEVMAVVQTAMLAGLPYMALRDAILAHPTMAEGLNALFSNVPAKSG
ncbi:mercuric reductase [Manganibacter manganicus]|uniref:Mercuric reductase n=1 Tax=Manganibacter manganicus TaxID=1873176 RepID=A0A1V8RL15_9HYPH|nr:mercuric reductase [Pseudaminobacter manganicus]OQM73900.1 mercuric reductase [Pseudaminobacter manganicus]